MCPPIRDANESETRFEKSGSLLCHEHVHAEPQVDSYSIVEIMRSTTGEQYSAEFKVELIAPEAIEQRIETEPDLRRHK